MLRIKHLLLILSLLLMPSIISAAVIDGNPDGELTLIEFYDYQCSHCRLMADVIDLLIDKNPDLKVEYRVIPVLGKDSWYVARATLVARIQGKFEAFHDAIVAKKGKITPEVVRRVASRIGIDMSRFDDTLDSEVVTKEINDNLALSRDFNVRSIPTIVVKSSSAKTEGKRFVGTTTYLHLQEALANLRPKSQKNSSEHG